MHKVRLSVLSKPHLCAWGNDAASEVVIPQHVNRKLFPNPLYSPIRPQIISERVSFN
jgi:hypothetical protein